MSSRAIRQWTSAFFALCITALFLSATASAAEVRRAAEPVPNHYIVALRDHTKPADADRLANALARKYDGELLAVWKSVVKGFWVRMSPKDAARLAGDKRVVSVSEDAVMRDSATQITGAGTFPGSGTPPNPADPLWHLTRINHRTPTSAGSGLTDDQYFRYDYESSGAGVSVYVVDSGVVWTHKEFVGRDIATITASNLVADPTAARADVPVDHVPADPSNSWEPYNRDAHFNGHGTACASLVVGNNVGVAKGVRLIPVKVIAANVEKNQLSSSTAMLINALEWIKTHAQPPAVVSLSQFRKIEGSCDGDNWKDCMTGPDAEVFERAVINLIDAGIPVIVSANNQSDDACRTTPARLSRRGGRAYVINGQLRPGRVITVGGTGLDDERFEDTSTPADPGSNYGQCVDIWAPAKRITVATPIPDDLSYRTEAYSGTSFSAPIVAGVVARFLAEDVALRANAIATADAVWQRLEETATRISPATLGKASPNLLVYAGPLTLSKPKIARSGSSVTLSVDIVNSNPQKTYTYKWYSGVPGRPVGPALSEQPSYAFTPATTNQYWVRVTFVNEENKSVVTDSAATEVRAIDCAPAVSAPIVEIQQSDGSWSPSTGWFNWDEAGRNARIRVEVTASGEYCYRWDSVPASGTPLADGRTSASSLSLPVSITTDPMRLFTLTVSACSDSTCSAVTDSVQLRMCPKPDITQNPVSTYFYDPINEPKEAIKVAATGGSIQYTWYLETTSGPKPARIRIDNTTTRLEHADTLSAPPETGRYFARVSNECSKPVDSTVTSVKVCDFDYVDNGAVITTTNPDRTTTGWRLGVTADGAPELTVLPETMTTIQLTPKSPLRTPAWRSGIGYSWSVNGIVNESTRSDTITLPASNEQKRLVKFVAFDPETGCRRERYFLVRCPTCLPSCETYEDINVLAAQCGSPTATPTYRAPLGGYVVIKPIVVNLGGLKIPEEDLSRYTTVWKDGNGHVIAEAEPWLLKRNVTEVPEDITFSVLCGGVAEATMTIRIERQADLVCPPDKPCTMACPRPRKIRHDGVAVDYVYVNDGESVTLEVPETGTGYAYEWHRDSETSADETFDQAEAVTVSPHRTTMYWVVTTTPNGPEQSLKLPAIVNDTVSREIKIMPEYQTVVANGVAWIKGEFERKNLTTQYEWRRGPTYDVTQPVIADGEILALANLADDATFWLRIRHNNGTTVEEHWSKLATVVVTCTPTINGTVTVVPPSGRVTRAQTPYIEVWGYGKNLRYSWYRDDELAAYGPALFPTLSARATKFNAHLEDACGTAVTLPDTWLYRCVPIIDQQPQKKVIKSGQTATLTIAATPAIDGELLSYRWYRASDPTMQNPLPATGPSLDVPSADAGDYFSAVLSTCAVTNDHTLKSDIATVEVCSTPAIESYTPPGSITSAGQSATISVLATGKELTYQWYQGESGSPSSILLNGETNFQLTASPSSTTNYWCKITSQGVCTTDGPTIAINVCRSPVFSDQPDSAKIFSGETAMLSAAASETLGNPVTLQWYESVDGGPFGPITGATETTYTTVPLTTQRAYQVKATAGDGGMCSAWSEVATVSLCTYGEIIGGPSDREIAKGESTMLQVVVSPAYDKFITWYRGESGDTSDPVAGGYLNAVANVSPTATTKYWAKVEHEGCTSRTTTTTVHVSIPTITTQPSGGIVAANGTLTLTVATNGTAGETFQWFAGTPNGTNAPIAGATSTSHVAQPQVTTSYFVRVTGSRGFVVTSDIATVTVCSPPSITATSGPHAIRLGQSAQLSVSANGANLTYQWYAGTSPNATWAVPGGNGIYATVSPNTTSTYWAQVKSDGVCTSNSGNVTVDVCTDPSISTQPASQMIASGGNATMSVVASATTGAMTYQWYRGVSGNTSQPITGATGASHTATSLTADSQFWVRMTRGACWKDSDTATITVCNLGASASGTARTTSGQQATITATVTSSRITYPTITFYRGAAGDISTPLQSSTNPQLVVYPTSTTTYWARVYDGTCTANTSAHTVDVCIPAISAHPSGGTIASGAPFTISVTAGGTSPLTYQWYRGNTGDTSQPISGAVDSTVTVYPTATTNYWVRVNGSCNVPADSNAATVTVCAPPSINGTSGPHYIRSGQSAQISVSASGSSLSYQWYSGTSGNTSSPIAGATGVSTTVYPTSTTTYWVQVKSYGVCNANSGNVIVDVCTDPQITVDPTSRQIRVNETTTLNVTVSATGGPVTYQWYRGAAGDTSQPISGAIASAYTTPALTSDTNYWVRVSRGPACYDDSTTATVTVCGISASLSGTSQTTSGQAATLTATTYYSRVAYPTITFYRGAKGDTSNPVQSSTSTQLTVYPTSTTTYWARVSDGTCPVDTDAHTVNVCIPTINSHPSGATVAANTPVTLTVGAGGTSALTYQWFKGNVGDTSQPVGGNSYQVSVSTPTTANYWCRVSGSCGVSVNSNAATVTICTPPSFFANSGPHMIQSGAQVTLSSSFTGADSYQWYEGPSGGGSPVGGVTTSPYLTVSPASTTTYWAQARSGGACPSNSPAISVDVCTTPSITSQPASTTIPTNTSTTLTVTASASPGAVTYQWYLGASGDTSQPLTGATNASYTTPALTSQTQYWVRVTRGACSVNSATATVTVCIPPYVWLSTFDWGDCWGLEVRPVSGGYGSWRYRWYKGPVGNVAASVDYGESGFSRNAICPTATETWWVRVSNYDNPGCYKDVSATIYPR